MRVLSWRSLSLKTSLEAFFVSTWLDIVRFPLFLFLSSPLILSACAYKPPSLVFETGNLSDSEWSRAQDECDYEAEKATGSAPINVAHSRWQRLYIQCIELKGIKYLGTTDQQLAKPKS
ncbi:hypothetical protein AB4097_12070 [Microvirga sp. 2MCAF35]|uniref:hypothetical protein n=1 Tax=Microvirga sp. 2MCAF35 TaxID=3232987 RepID=UPI003F9D0D9E